MKKIILGFLLLISTISFSQVIEGGTGRCVVTGNPNSIASLQNIDVRYSCSEAVVKTTGAIYVYIPTNAPGSKWVLQAATSSVDTTLAGDVTGGINTNVISKIKGYTVENKAPQNKEFLKYDGSKWTPDSISLTTLPILSASRILGRGSASSGTPQELTVGTGLGISGTVINNTAPDQVVSLAAGVGIAITGTYPSFTIDNTQPDQNLTLIGAGINVVSGSYPAYTITATEVDGLTNNEGSLSVLAGSGTSSVIHSNTSGSTDVVLEAGTNITLAEVGNTITISSSAGGGGTAAGNNTEVQLNVAGVLGTADSFVVTQTPSDRVGIGKKTGLGARLHIQSQGAGSEPAILVDNNTGKRVANINSTGGLVLGGIVASGGTGTLELNRYSDGSKYGSLYIAENDSTFIVDAHKDRLMFVSDNNSMGLISKAGIKLGFEAYSQATASAILDINGIPFSGGAKGFAPPRGNHTQRNSIVSPTQLLIFGNTSTGKLNYYNGSWRAIADSASVATSLASYVPLAGGTMTGNLLFSPDNTYDIGTSAATRPRSIYTGTSFQTSATGKFSFDSRGSIVASADGVFRLGDNAGTSFGRLLFGGTTASYFGIKRNGTQAQFRLGDDTGYSEVAAGSLILGGNTMSASLIADMQSTSKAFRMPSMTTTQRNAIASPIGGAMIFNTTTSKPNWYNAGTVSWEEPGTGNGTVTSIVAGSSNTTKGLSAVESPAGTYTIGLSLGSLGVISPLTASDTSTYIVTQKAIGFENSKVEIRNLVYDAYGESYTNTSANLGILTSNVEYDLKLASTGLNKNFTYNSGTGILKYIGTISKVVVCDFRGSFTSTITGDFKVRIYTAPATGSTWTLLTEQLGHWDVIGTPLIFSLRRRTTLTQGMRVKVVIWQQPTGTSYIQSGTFSVDGVTTN